MVTRMFHVLYVPDGLIAGCLDAIRVLANPAEKHRAHITVRGPYRHGRPRVDTINRLIESSEIKIHGSGNFFAFGQNTVFLQCRSPRLRAVWDKPDYDFNPHITLYDGSSREFASRLWEIVSSRSYEISFVAGPLTPLVSARRYQGGMALQADLDLRLLRTVADLDIDGVRVASLSQDERLNAIASLCDFLSSIDSRLDFSSRQATAHEGLEIEIKQVDVLSDALSSVKALAKKNGATLGFLPSGAFDAYAQRGWVLAAFADGDLVGYVVYRESRQRAVLVHLCIDERLRGQGLARQLFYRVVSRTAGLHGILASTRRDFRAHTLWPRLGFAAIGERPGRGVNQTVLTQWWYEHPHATLFSSNTPYVGAQSPIDVAIDLDVFNDLIMPYSREGAEESRLLQSDWLIDELQLCVTGELFNEIDRFVDPQVRRGQRALAHDFKRISGTTEQLHRIYSLLSSILGEADNDPQSSALRHLAHTAVAEVEYFVTRNAQLLESKDAIQRAIGVTPLRPADLVIQIGQVRDDASYQPARLHGTTLQVKGVDRHQRKRLEDLFVNKALGERKSAFQQKLSALLASHSTVESGVVLDGGEPIALFGLVKCNSNLLLVPCLRLRPGRLARTLARQIVSLAIESSIASSSCLTSVTDGWLDPYVEEALAECGFVKTGAQWLKLNYSAVGTEDEVSAGLKSLLGTVRDSGLDLPDTRMFRTNTASQLTAAGTVLVERTLRPLKLTNGTLDTLVLPVMPRWAQHLFDSGLAEQTLLGARADLVMSWENAYYRSPRSLGDISNPFRILWYVSQDSRYIGTGQIRAYSVGTSAEVLPASQAYNRFKRLGVYDLQHILEISGGDPDGDVMVIRFCDTETFKTPIDRKRFSALLAISDQKKPSLRGPQRISEKAFAEIYSQGQS